jgi:integrase/recombinase XerD
MAANLEWTVPNNKESIQLLHELFGPEHVHFDTSLLHEEPLIRKWFPYDAATANIIREHLVQLTKLMTLKGFSPKTKKAYCGHIRRFCRIHAEVYLELEAYNAT